MSTRATGETFRCYLVTNKGRVDTPNIRSHFYADSFRFRDKESLPLKELSCLLIHFLDKRTPTKIFFRFPSDF